MLCKQLSGNGQSSADNYMVKQGSLDMTLKESKGCINQVGDLFLLLYTCTCTCTCTNPLNK